MKAILIARVSTEEQKEAGNSLPAQIARLERYCQSKNFQVLKTFSFDESAYKNNRVEFDQILEFILNQNEKLAVCCDKVDRLSRNMFDQRISMLYEKSLKDEIELHFTSEGQVINSQISAVEKFQFGISLGLAKYFSDAVSDNVKRALEQKLKKGEWPQKAPYGYRNIKHPDGIKDIIINEYEAAIIKKTFELYATGAYSMDLLCAKINKDFNLSWSKGYIDHVLKYKFYHGIMEWSNTEYKHKYPTIISETLFNQVQEVKANYAKKKYKYAGKPYIYRGLIKCAECGLSVTPEQHKGFVYYHCTQYNGKHDAKWLREEEVTNQIEKVFKKLMVPEDILNQIYETLENTHKDKMDFQIKHNQELTKRHQEITLMLDNLYMDKLKGRITDNEYDRFYQNLRNQLTEINIKLSNLQEADDNYYITAKYILNLTKQAFELFKSSEVEEKRQLIKLVLQNIELKDEKLLFQAQKPFNLLLDCSERQTWCAW
ncbi:hypothetical protein A3F66_04415 [candidate division TM6 bacterium RIFCSPHIGHO2_12_FULL_32_22]|nr:MAG: hypothetical protein A3F66_04415 [candidate division TM6 bacterium RIFCSPHIGHO2_12_FULL_32_22]